MLTSRITVPTPPNPEIEDIFSSALGNLFTDDIQNSHGVPGQSVVYTSPRFGPLALDIPAHPDVEDGRKLFAHYLWNSGIIVAEGIEQASSEDSGSTTCGFERVYWDVRGKSVLELGAGTALPSLISALSGAASVTITDHPLSPALTTGAIEQNIRQNLFPSTPGKQSQRSNSQLKVRGYVWGEQKMYSVETHGKPGSPDRPQLYDMMILADCLWMPSQHEKLAESIRLQLKPNGCAIVVAGFHTGRYTVGQFFEIAKGTHRTQYPDTSTADNKPAESSSAGLIAAEMYEIDVDGRRRDWKSVREDESKEAAKRWCAVAILVKS